MPWFNPKKANYNWGGGSFQQPWGPSLPRERSYFHHRVSKCRCAQPPEGCEGAKSLVGGLPKAVALSPGQELPGEGVCLALPGLQASQDRLEILIFIQTKQN